MAKKTNEDLVCLSRQELNDIVERAAERGSHRALKSIGLHDDKAAGDIDNLRSFISAYEAGKSELFKTIVRGFGVLLLGALGIGLAILMKTKGGA